MTWHLDGHSSANPHRTLGSGPPSGAHQGFGPSSSAPLRTAHASWPSRGLYSDREAFAMRGASSPRGDSKARPSRVCAFLSSNWQLALQILTAAYALFTCTTFFFHRQGGSFQSAGLTGKLLHLPYNQSLAEGMVAQGAVRIAPEGTGGRAPSEMALPKDFDWKAYLRWNADIHAAGIDRQELAEAHYVSNGAAEQRLYKAARVTIRYSACGGIFNQQYCHLSSLLLAIMAEADELVWPPMQERASFARRFHTDPARNTQSWKYVDASSLWDLPLIQKNMRERFNLNITKHAPNCKLPNLLEPQTAFQDCPLAGDYDLHVKFANTMYIQHLAPKELLQQLFVAVRDTMVINKVGHPSNVLIDLPCTLFIMDVRASPLVEDIASALGWAPEMHMLAEKVIAGIQADGSATVYNGVHLRMEKDAIDWAIDTGGTGQYWDHFIRTMRKAHFDQNPRLLYVASGLLRSGVDDEASRQEMTRLSTEIVLLKFASRIVHKETFLTKTELDGLLNEQSALIDFLVLRQAWAVVGVGTSTFSFYLQEQRLMDGRDPRDMTLLMMPTIGTDELFFSSAVVAIKTRAKLASQFRLHETCQRATLEPCFST